MESGFTFLHRELPSRRDLPIPARSTLQQARPQKVMRRWVVDRTVKTRGSLKAWLSALCGSWTIFAVADDQVLTALLNWLGS